MDCNRVSRIVSSTALGSSDLSHKAVRKCKPALCASTEWEEVREILETGFLSFRSETGSWRREFSYNIRAKGPISNLVRDAQVDDGGRCIQQLVGRVSGC